jgi:hypothetical protein
MAWPRPAPPDIVLDEDDPPITPQSLRGKPVDLISKLPLPSNDLMQWSPRYEPFPAEFWEKTQGRTKVAFGTQGVVLSVSQACLRKLVRWHPVFWIYVRSCRSKSDEDRRLAAYDRKQAEKAVTV